MTTLFMFDDVDVNLLPAGAYAYAGYLDGRYANFAQVKAAHPQAHLVGIAVRASDDGDALDVEPGDATISQAPDWVKRQHARGCARPIVYVSAANGKLMVDTLTAAGISRPSYRLWLAHYGAGQHTCGPKTCGYAQADATQFTSKALGRSLDQSLLADDFFGAPALKFPVKQGDAGTEVVTLQKMLNAWASVIGLVPVLVPDGAFGQKTLAAVQRAQAHFNLPRTGACDHTLWTNLAGQPTQKPVPGRSAYRPVARQGHQQGQRCDLQLAAGGRRQQVPGRRDRKRRSQGARRLDRHRHQGRHRDPRSPGIPVEDARGQRSRLGAVGRGSLLQPEVAVRPISGFLRTTMPRSRPPPRLPTGGGLGDGQPQVADDDGGRPATQDNRHSRRARAHGA